MYQWETKGAGRRIRNPAANPTERAFVDQQLDAYRLGVSKGKQSTKGAGKGQLGKGKDSNESKPKNFWTTWTCTFCQDSNLGRHNWCEGCGLHHLDAAHHSEKEILKEFNGKAKGKGKDKGKTKGNGKGASGQKDAGTKEVEPKAETTEEQSVEAQTATATAKSLQFFGISPAPQVEQLKPYPKPTVKAEDASMEVSSEDAVQQLEKDLETAVAHNSPVSILNLYKKEIAEAKAATTKATKVTKEISFEALQKRINNSQSAATAALERHQGHVKALDEEMAKMQKIRDHSIADFAASQEAFASRQREDVQEFARRAAAAGAPQAAAEATDSSAKAQSPAALQLSVAKAMHDLQRDSAHTAADPPVCTATTDACTVNSLASLWHFYQHVGLGGIPAVTFQGLAVPPHIAHTLMGDTIWKSYWDVSSSEVTADQFIPHTMHNALRYVVNTKSQQLEAMAEAKDAAFAKLQAAKQAADTRRKAGDPF